MNILLGSLILAYLLALCIYCFLDVWHECEFQSAQAEHEAVLDKLWADDV